VDEEGTQLIKVDQNKIFKSVNEVILAIQDSGQQELAMKLYLQGAQAINRTMDRSTTEELAYEFMSQALLIYQEEISDTEAKSFAINLICATLFSLNCFTEENHATLMANAMSGCAVLLKKPAQCEAIINASNLHNS
jgi:vacuolar protein sorting-associated protein 35